MSMISIQMESGHPDAALVIIQDAKVKFDDIFDTVEKNDDDNPDSLGDAAERRESLL